MKKYSWILALLVALAVGVGFVGCDDDPLPPPGENVVWEIANFTGKTIVEDGEYVSDQLGFQLQDKTTASIAISGSSLVLKATSANYKALFLQTGTEAGGTSYYHTNGFKPTAGKIYKMTVNAAVDSGTGSLRLKANAAESTEQTYALTTTAVDCVYFWTQGSGNFEFNTVGTATNTGILINSVKIVELTATTAWEVPNFTGADVTSNPEYVGNLGLQAADKDNTSLTISSNALVIKATSGTYKTLTLQTGTAAGGTSYYQNAGFNAVTGTTYKITIRASVESTGQMRVRDSNRTGDNNWTNFTPTITPANYEYIWTQASGNFSIDTGSTPTNAGLIIHSIKIEKLN